MRAEKLSEWNIETEKGSIETMSGCIDFGLNLN